MRTNFPRLLPAGRCYWTHNCCFRDATARYVRGQNNFKGHSATTIARSYTPWLFVGSNERHSLRKQSSHSPWTVEIHRKFHQEHAPTELSLVFANKIRRVGACLQAISSICYNLITRNVFVLMYRDSTNILIVYGRCTGTFDSSCISKEDVPLNGIQDCRL
jgi:hypothetical protein